jgi:peptidyl-prolyl cis-trans isomerase B (cyclophilin B)
MPEHISLHQSSDHRLPALRLWAPLLILSLLPAFACGRYRARHELERDKYFAQIIQRVDHRWMGEDRFFEDNLLANPYPEVRKGCAIALGQIGSPHALPLLYRAVRTGDAAVRAASAFAIGQIEDRERLIKKNLAPDPEATTALLFLLRDPSLTVQMRAIEALGKSGSQLEAAEIVRQVDRFAYTGSPTDRAYIGFAITALARLKDPIALAELKRWGKAENSELRSSALEALALLNRTGASPTTGSATDSGSAPVSPVAADRVRDMPARPSAVTDTVGLALAANRRNSTIAMVETARGPLEIELFRADAPRTVASFVLQAKRGSYNGFVFDEIVPAKKIEGNITGSQVGFNIAPDGEINMRPFERGSVGLSFANKNSPNGRFFIALAPQPYLDGVDTCFGRVISGMQIADKLTAGDRILGIHIAETTALGDRVRY